MADPKNDKMTLAQVAHARRSSLVYENIYARIERLEQAHIEQAEKQARGTKLSGKTAEIQADSKN